MLLLRELEVVVCAGENQDHYVRIGGYTTQCGGMSAHTNSNVLVSSTINMAGALSAAVVLLASMIWGRQVSYQLVTVYAA